MKSHDNITFFYKSAKKHLQTQRLWLTVVELSVQYLVIVGVQACKTPSSSKQLWSNGAAYLTVMHLKRASHDHWESSRGLYQASQSFILRWRRSSESLQPNKTRTQCEAMLCNMRKTHYLKYHDTYHVSFHTSIHFLYRFVFLKVAGAGYRAWWPRHPCPLQLALALLWGRSVAPRPRQR